MEPQVRQRTFPHIIIDPEIMGGVPTIRVLRLPVATVVASVAAGMTPAEILKKYPGLPPEAIPESLRFAAIVVGNIVAGNTVGGGAADYVARPGDRVVVVELSDAVYAGTVTWVNKGPLSPLRAQLLESILEEDRPVFEALAREDRTIRE